LSDTYKTAKIYFITSRVADIIRTAYYIPTLDVMKLIFAVLHVSLMSTYE